MRYSLFFFDSRRLATFIICLIAHVNVVVRGQDGVKPCPTNSSMLGYTNSTLLFNDMFSIYMAVADGKDIPPPYVFPLCPFTTIDLDNKFNGVIFPILSHTVIVCGYSGSSDQLCVFRGGHYQVYLHNYFEYEEVYFIGITFENSKELSVSGSGLPESWAVFVDCHWKKNHGGILIHDFDNNSSPKRKLEHVPGNSGRRLLDKINDDFTTKNGLNLNQNSSFRDINDILKTLEHFRRSVVSSVLTAQHKNNLIQSQRRKLQDQRNSLMTTTSMYLEFRNCTFRENYVDQWMIHNNGGTVVFEGSIFDGHYPKKTNDKAPSTITLSMTFHYGHVYIIESHFTNNDLIIAPIILDPSSYLEMNIGNRGHNNSGFTNCEGILQLEEGSTCFLDGNCPSYCCQFGDSSCDLDTSKASVVTTGSVKEDFHDSYYEVDDDYDAAAIDGMMDLLQSQNEDSGVKVMSRVSFLCGLISLVLFSILTL